MSLLLRRLTGGFDRRRRSAAAWRFASTQRSLKEKTPNDLFKFERRTIAFQEAHGWRQLRHCVDCVEEFHTWHFQYIHFDGSGVNNFCEVFCGEMRFNVRGYNITTKRPMAQSTSKISSKQFFNMAYMTRNANFENCNFLVYRKKNVKYWKALFSEVSSWNFVAECQRKKMAPSLPNTTAEFPQKPSWTSIKCTLLCNYGSLGMSSFCSRLTPYNLSLTLKEPNSQNEDANLKVKLSRVRWANQDLCWREVSLTKWQNWVASTVADIKTSRLRWTDSPPNYLQHSKLPPTEVKARLGMWQVGVLLQTPLQ